jgi:hypothetical protein
MLRTVVFTRCQLPTGTSGLSYLKDKTNQERLISYVRDVLDSAAALPRETSHDHCVFYL